MAHTRYLKLKCGFKYLKILKYFDIKNLNVDKPTERKKDHEIYLHCLQG